MSELLSTLAVILEALAPADGRATLAGLTGSSPAFALAQLLAKDRRPYLVVTADSDSAAELCRELRFYSGLGEQVAHFPAWDSALLEASPHPDVTGERLNTLFRLLDGQARAVVAPLPAVLQRVLPRHTLGEVSQYLVAGEEVPRDDLLTKLVKLGYAPVPLVEDRGSFASRGGIIDIFPPNLPEPVRIEFFGDFVDTIRTFDPVSQRSLRPLSELVILPSREVILTPDILKEFTSRLKRRCDEIDITVPRRRELLEQLQNAIYPPGIEYLLPLFHPPLETIFDYAGAEVVTVLVDQEGLTAAREEWASDLALAGQRALERDLITAPEAELFLLDTANDLADLPGRQLRIPALELAGTVVAGTTCRLVTDGNSDLKLDLAPDSEGVLKPLVERLNAWLAE
ncbi:MAG TPA: transcription-repair coupling factor, partial [Geobacteraceae bacterium]